MHRQLRWLDKFSVARFCAIRYASAKPFHSKFAAYGGVRHIKEIPLSYPTTENYKDFAFLRSLQESGLLGWPIDFECNNQTAEQVAETLGYWFGHDNWKKDGGSFVQFGQDGSGSLYCLWLYPGLTGEAPIVFFGSEGERSLVCGSTREFAALITSGLLPFEGGWVEPSEEDLNEIDWGVLKKLGLEHTKGLVVKPEQCQESAETKHPSFEGWVSRHVG